MYEEKIAMFEHAFVNTSLKSSILFFPERKQRGIDRSYLLHILKNEGYFCFVSRPSDLLRKGGERKVCFKGSTLILFQLQKSACESKKSVFEDESARREFSRPLKHIGTSFFEVICSFFLFFLFLLLLLLYLRIPRVRVFVSNIRWNGNFRKFYFYSREYFFQFSNFFRNNEFLSKRFGFFSSPRASTCFEAKIKFNIKLFHLSLRPSNLKWFSLKNK